MSPMPPSAVRAVAVIGLLPCALPAQQVADTAFRPQPVAPSYAPGAGPLVLVDEAHNDAGHVDSAFRAFAAVLHLDGYRVAALGEKLTDTALQRADILVIINPLADRNVNDWSLPTPSAFEEAEIAAVHDWVSGGGALLLAGDHMPFAGAATEMARAFGFAFHNGFVVDTSTWDPLVFRRSDSSLGRHPILDGRHPDERVDSVATFWGLAFRALDSAATPLMTFGPAVISYEPEVAWRFPPGTPSPPVAGWLQGAARVVGMGRVVVLGESGMLSAHVSGPRRVPVGMNAPVASQNQQFVLNVMHWLTGLLPTGSD